MTEVLKIGQLYKAHSYTSNNSINVWTEHGAQLWRDCNVMLYLGRSAQYYHVYVQQYGMCKISPLTHAFTPMGAQDD